MIADKPPQRCQACWILLGEVLTHPGAQRIVGGRIRLFVITSCIHSSQNVEQRLVGIQLIVGFRGRRRFKRSLGNDDIAFWMISQRMLPPVAVVIPIYIFFQQLNLLDTWAALIIAYVASHLPIVVWLMRDYFQSVPLELEESAAIDGASRYRIFRSIVVPLAVPGLVATFLFVLVFAWNEYLIALFLTSANAQTLPLTVAAQNATRGPQWWYMSVLILIMIGPVIAMAIALERFIARGLLVGAVKG